MIATTTPTAAGCASDESTLDALGTRKAERGPARPSTPRWPICSRSASCERTSRSWSSRCSTRATPSTPTRRAPPRTPRPTPFGIVYPPAYAERMPAGFDHLRLECGLLADEGAPVSATVRFLQASGERHQAVERRIELPAPGEPVEFAFDGLEGRARLRVDPAGEGVLRVRVLRAQHHALRRAGGRPRRGAEAQPALHPRGGERTRLALHLAAGGPRLREREHLPGARHARGRHGGGGGDRASRPSRRWRRRAAATCSTAPRSRRRCCCTCTRCPSWSARRSRARTRPCGRWWSARRPPRPRTCSTSTR